MKKINWKRYLTAAAILLFWQCLGYAVPLPFSPIFRFTASSSQFSIVGALIAFGSAFVADIFIDRRQKAHPSSPKPEKHRRSLR